MIAHLIRWSVANRFLVLLATAFAVAWGVLAVRNTAVDALPCSRTAPICIGLARGCLST